MDEVDEILAMGEPEGAEALEDELPVSEIGLDAAVDGLFEAVVAQDKARFKDELKRAVRMVVLESGSAPEADTLPMA